MAKKEKPLQPLVRARRENQKIFAKANRNMTSRPDLKETARFSGKKSTRDYTKTLFSEDELAKAVEWAERRKRGKENSHRQK